MSAVLWPAFEQLEALAGVSAAWTAMLADGGATWIQRDLGIGPNPALADHIGWVGPYFVAVAIFFFAFTSIIGNYSYSEMAMAFLGVGTTAGLMVLRCIVLLMVWKAPAWIVVLVGAAGGVALALT